MTQASTDTDSDFQPMMETPEARDVLRRRHVSGTEAVDGETEGDSQDSVFDAEAIAAAIRQPTWQRQAKWRTSDYRGRPRGVIR